MNFAEIAAPEKAGFSSKRMERVDALLRRYVDHGHIAGAGGLVYRKGQVVYASAHGYRDREAGAPMTLDTILRIYSMTKPITTVAALLLMEEGAFLLNEPVAKYLPAFEEVQVYAGPGQRSTAGGAGACAHDPGSHAPHSGSQLRLVSGFGGGGDVPPDFR